MTAARSDSNAVPVISGKSNSNQNTSSGPVSALVIIHAVCLAGSFLLLFPVGVVALRWFGWFTVHWILQIFATLICVIGLIVAIAFSAKDPEYDSFDESHQIIGIVVVLSLIVQAWLGYSHHRNYKKLGRRTWFSYSHLWAGRVVIVLGMVNAVLYVNLPPFVIPTRWRCNAKVDRGFSLAGSKPGSIGIAILALVILIGTFISVYFGTKRQRPAAGAGRFAPSDIPLNSYNPPRAEGTGYNHL